MHDMMWSWVHTFSFIELALWLILNGAGSRSIRNHGYSGTTTLARHEMDEIVHLLWKVRHCRYRTWPLMNTYCRLDLASSEHGREESERGLVADATWQWWGAVPSCIYLPVASVLMGHKSKKLRACQNEHPTPLKDVDKMTSGSMTQSRTSLGLHCSINDQGSTKTTGVE